MRTWLFEQKSIPIYPVRWAYLCRWQNSQPISKTKRKVSCLHAPSSDFFLYPWLWKEVCWIRHNRNCICNLAFDPTFSFPTFSTKWVPRGLNPTFSLDANLCPFLSPFYYEIFYLIFNTFAFTLVFYICISFLPSPHSISNIKFFWYLKEVQFLIFSDIWRLIFSSPDIRTSVIQKGEQREHSIVTGWRAWERKCKIASQKGKQKKNKLLFF